MKPLRVNDPPAVSLKDVITASSKVLYSIHSIFPLDIVPDHLSIDKYKVTVQLRFLLGVEFTHILLIEDIKDIDLDLEILYGTIRILPNSPGQEWVSITHLKRAEARRARAIISGLMIARTQNIDLSTIAEAELLDQIVACGTTYD